MKKQDAQKEIEIQTYQSEASWPETSAAILEALKMMRLEEETT